MTIRARRAPTMAVALLVAGLAVAMLGLGPSPSEAAGITPPPERWIDSKH